MNVHNKCILSIVLFFLISCRSLADPSHCLQPSTWQGVLSLDGVSLTIRINFALNSSNELTTTLDIPAREVTKFPVNLSSCTSDSVAIDILLNGRNARYAAQIQGDSLVGYWHEDKYHLPLTLQKGKTTKRPQNPKGPFPYHSQEVTYSNSDNTIQYGATFTWPKNQLHSPVVLLLTGSGQQDRDETILDHKPFWIIADYLTRRGIAVLRVDDRGIGKTTGNASGATSKDFAQDALVAIRYLKKRQR